MGLNILIDLDIFTFGIFEFISNVSLSWVPPISLLFLDFGGWAPTCFAKIPKRKKRIMKMMNFSILFLSTLLVILCDHDTAVTTSLYGHTLTASTMADHYGYKECSGHSLGAFLLERELLWAIAPLEICSVSH